MAEEKLAKDAPLEQFDINQQKIGRGAPTLAELQAELAPAVGAVPVRALSPELKALIDKIGDPSHLRSMRKSEFIDLVAGLKGKVPEICEAYNSIYKNPTNNNFDLAKYLNEPGIFAGKSFYALLSDVTLSKGSAVARVVARIPEIASSGYSGSNAYDAKKVSEAIAKLVKENGLSKDEIEFVRSLFSGKIPNSFPAESAVLRQALDRARIAAPSSQKGEHRTSPAPEMPKKDSLNEKKHRKFAAPEVEVTVFPAGDNKLSAKDEYAVHKKSIDALKPGGNFVAKGARREWTRGDDGRIYFNADGEADRTWGCLADSLYYIPSKKDGVLSFHQVVIRIEGGENVGYKDPKTGALFNVKGDPVK